MVVVVIAAFFNFMGLIYASGGAGGCGCGGSVGKQLKDDLSGPELYSCDFILEI